MTNPIRKTHRIMAYRITAVVMLVAAIAVAFISVPAGYGVAVFAAGFQLAADKLRSDHGWRKLANARLATKEALMGLR